MKVVALLGCVLLVAQGCASPGVSPGKPPPDLEYHVAPPDVLSIIVRPEPAIPRIVTVRPDGMLSLDLIGDVRVQGKTVAQIQQEIETRLAEFIVHPSVTVLLESSNSREFYVWGEVLRPGSYPLIGGVTVADALAHASGPARFASLSSSRLVRPTGEAPLTFAIDLEAITYEGDGTTNYQLQPGDIVYVPPNAWGKVGYALGTIFFPLQQVLGLGRSIVVTTQPY